MISRFPFTPRSCHHDYRYYAIFFGEPFIHRDFIYYYDGWDLRVIGYDRDGGGITRTALQELIEEACSRWTIRSVAVESPGLVQLSSFTREIVNRPNREVEHEFVIPNPKPFLRKQRKAIRRSKKVGIHSSVAHQKQFSSQHYRLLDEYIRSWESNLYYKSEFLTSLFFLLATPRSVLVNSFLRGELVGFSMGNIVDTLGIFRVLVTKSDIPGVSDSLHAATIEALWNRGAREITLGFSLNSGLMAFKRKWGGQKRWRGSYELLFTRGSTPPYYLWATRLARIP